MRLPEHRYLHQISAWGAKVGIYNYISRMVERQFIKRILRRDLEIRLPNDRRLKLPAWSQFSSVVWVTSGHADDGCEEIVESFARPDGTFFDIGAHIGYWSVRMAHCSRQVVAIEPNRCCTEALIGNLTAIKGAQIFPCAVSDARGERRLFADASAPLSKLLDADGATDRPGEVIHVPTRTVDDIWLELGRPNVWGVKIDTEGHENCVFGGGRTFFDSCRPLVLVETCGAEFAKISEYFAGLDYEAGWLSDRIYGQRQRLTRTSIAAAAAEFQSGMLFLLPAWTRNHAGWKAVRQDYVVAR